MGCILGYRLMMGSRCGDVDPAVVLYLMDKCSLSTHEADTLLNKKSGFLGLCGRADVRAVVAEAEAGNEKAQLAIEVIYVRPANCPLQMNCSLVKAL